MNFCYLRKAELCKNFGISRSTLERIVANGTFPKPYLLGKRIVVWRSDEVEEYLNSLTRLDDAYVNSNSKNNF